MASPEVPAPSWNMTSTIDVGLKLAATLHTYIQLCFDGKVYFKDLLHEISATATVLQQLHGMIETDSAAAAEVQSRPQLFRQSGLEEIRELASKCGRIYKNIIVVIQKAAHKGPKPYQEPGDVDPTYLLKSLTSLRTMDYNWLEEPLDCCQEQLKWLKIMLLVDVQLAHLAHLHLDTSGSRPTGTFDRELGLRAAAEKLWHRQAYLGRKMGKKWEREHKEQDDDQTSVTTSDTATTSDTESERSVRFPDNSGPASTGPLPPMPTFSPKSKKKRPDQVSICSTAIGDQDIVVEVYPPKAELKAMGLSGTPSPADDSPDGALPKKTLPEDGKENQVNGSTPDPQDADKGGEATETSNDPLPMNKDTELALLSSGLFSSRLPRLLQRWSGAIFGSRGGSDSTLFDSESHDLEVWAVPAVVPTTGLIMRVPFGHKALKKALQRVLRNSKDGPLGVFTGMTQTQQAIIEAVRQTANLRGPQARTCVGYHEIKRENQEPTCLVFFSLSQPDLPIRLKDAVGRMHEIPFDVGSNWEGIRNYITEAFQGFSPPLLTNVQNGQYDLIKESTGLVVIPSVWAASVKPGQKLEMHMWFIRDLPKDRQPGRPAWHSGMGVGRRVVNPPPAPPAAPPFPVGPPPFLPAPLPRFPPAPAPRPRGPPRIIHVEPPRRSTVPRFKRRRWMAPSNKTGSDSDSDSDDDASEDSEQRERKAKERAELEVVDFVAMLRAFTDSKAKGKRAEHEGGEFGQFLERMIDISDAGSTIVTHQMWSGDSSSDSDSDFD
ncbi:hypothetical protein QBC42DRAFT_327728 [Cladorrhinum samala]|uniref:Ubiquitin-like domain-containing protein n=1 Tax=Cladorrhinum samala TaxID=585594 RepID=A0AAV9HZM7_9PEZI|nr:hypothetical protein QBC42DRAFT_327728 [Cladorrhinum samala]